MSCPAGQCGVGGWGGPLPGDPSNDSVLSATPTFGGIEVSWNLPTTNPHAVAYVIVWRALANNFAAAIKRAEVSATAYFDRIDDSFQYWYWIQVVSRNGTVGELIGPASAVAKPTLQATIEMLTDQIDQGLLAQSLKLKLDEISLLNSNLLQEILDRENGETSLAEAIADAQAGIAEAHTFILDEVASRTAANEAIIQQINGVAAAAGDDIAAVTQTLTAQIDSTNNTVNAMYTAQVNVNGLIGGFGLANNGTSVEAGFDVDKFWVGRTTNKVKPFIITGGIVHIAQAAIPVLTADKINGRDLVILSGAFTSLAWPAAGQTGFYLGGDGFRMGNANDGKYFQVLPNGDWTAPGIRVTNGSLIISGGSMSGIEISATDIRSSGWTGAGGNGFLIHSNGNVWINNLYARGDIEADSLKANTVMVQTAHIAGQAVSIPVGAFSPGLETESGVTMSVALTSSGAPVRVDGGCTVRYGGGGTASGSMTWEVQRVKGGVTTALMSGSLKYDGNSLTAQDGVFSFPPISDTPGSGAVTYRLFCSLSGSISLYNRGIFALELKK